MSEFVDFWRISDFSEKANELFQKKYPNETSHQNTIGIWFKELEEKGIHYVHRDPTRNDWKIFDEMDLKIAIYIMEKRRKVAGQQSWTLSAIYQGVQKECEVRGFPLDFEYSPGSVSLETLLKKLDGYMDERHKEFESRIQDQNALMLEHQKHQELQQEERQRMAFVELLQFQSNIRKKAEEEWEKEPEEKRYIKRLFRKEENWKERDKFINDYIEKESLYWLNSKQVVSDD